MNGNDLTIVVSAVVVALAFLAAFGRTAPASLGAWALRRLLVGVAGIAGLTVVASLWLSRVAAADVAACKAAANTYDCEDAWLVVVMAILAGGLAILFYVAGLVGLRVARRPQTAGAAG